MKLVLDSEAQAELRHAASFYEDCRDGLGEEFLDAVESAFAQIQRYPMLWRILKGRFRRYLVHHSPYAVIYTIDKRTIYVAAVMHLSVSPVTGNFEARTDELDTRREANLQEPRPNLCAHRSSK